MTTAYNSTVVGCEGNLITQKGGVVMETAETLERIKTIIKTIDNGSYRISRAYKKDRAFVSDDIMSTVKKELNALQNDLEKEL